MATFLTIILCVLIGWFVIENMRSREIATGIGKRACQRYDVQFLDGTVALTSMGLRRDARHNVSLRRTYEFEFSDSGNNRSKAYITMLGSQLEVLQMEVSDADP